MLRDLDLRDGQRCRARLRPEPDRAGQEGSRLRDSERRRRPALPGTHRSQRHDRGRMGLPASGSDRPRPSPKPLARAPAGASPPRAARAGHHAGPRRHNRDSSPGARRARPKPAPPRPRVLRSHPHNASSSSPEQDSNRSVAERSDPFFGVPVKSHQFDPDRSGPEVSVAPRRSGSSRCPAESSERRRSPYSSGPPRRTRQRRSARRG